MTDRRKHPGIITAEDLKRIKDWQINPRIEENYLNTWIDTRHLQAIIERMEAAEAYINGPTAARFKVWKLSRGE